VTAIFILLRHLNYSTGVLRGFAALGLVIACLAGFSMGRVYLMPSRPALNTMLLPTLYFALSVTLGCYVMSFWVAILEKDEIIITKLRQWAFGALAFETLTVAAYVIYLASSKPDPVLSTLRLLKGDLALVFWVALVLVGLLIPMLMTARNNFAKRIQPSILSTALGLIAVMIGGGAISVFVNAVKISTKKIY